MPAVVAIVGRPNVGKSRLFNRLSRRRISIVHDEPGVTRDLISADVDGYTIMDTGGFGLAPGDTPDQIVKAVDGQVLFALEVAEVIVFVIDGQKGLGPIDFEIAEKLRQGGKKVILVVNKIDNERYEAVVTDSYGLGLGEPLQVSAEHGSGESALREAIVAALPEDYATREVKKEQGERRLRICFVGRPNVGKSSIINRVLKSQRQIVSDVPGTTRESVDMDFDFPARKGGIWPFTLTDTAGMKKGTKLASSVEYFSQVRSINAIRFADVVFVVLDAVDGVGAQDKAIAGEAVEANKPVVVVVNKWDLAMDAFNEGRLEGYEKEVHYRKAFSEKVEKQLFFSPGSPVVFTSAKTGFSIQAMLRAARELDARLDLTLPTGHLNRTMQKISEKMPPPRVDGRRFRVYYAVQTGTRPYRIKMFCNQEHRLGDQYRRYLESNIIEEFGLHGCPILFDLVGKKPRDA